jgi:hypothetical protein
MNDQSPEEITVVIPTMKKFALIHEFPKTQLLVKYFYDTDDDKYKTSFEADMDDTAMMTLTSDYSGMAKEVFEKAHDKQYCIDLLTSVAFNKNIIDDMLGL